MKYKLIKLYPGSPQLGYVSEPLLKDGAEHYYMGSRFNPADFPKYWEKEKEFEIISYKYDDRIFTYGNSYSSDGRKYYNGRAVIKEKTLHLLPTSTIIHSVKRLSDNQIFTVGDKVITKDQDICEINSFHLSASDKNISIRLKGIYAITVYIECPIHLITSCEKPLFITEDNVPIYEGMDYYNWVYKNEHKKFFFKENAERYNKEYLEKKELRFSKKDLINCCTHIISENKLIINKVENWIKNNA